MIDKRRVELLLNEEDCRWLESVYGNTWKQRMEQHIASEIKLRRHDKNILRIKREWDY